MKLTVEQIMAVKSRGFLRNRGTDNFSGRVVAVGTVFTAENFCDMADLAKEFGCVFKGEHSVSPMRTGG